MSTRMLGSVAAYLTAHCRVPVRVVSAFGRAVTAHHGMSSGEVARRHRRPVRSVSISQSHVRLWHGPGETGTLCVMDHRMSDDELRRAIRVLRERADLARNEGRDDDADMLEKTIHGYQEEMSQRL